MVNEIITQKKSGKLAPLSCEHNDGLLFVKRIRQGVAAHLTSEAVAKYCTWYWKYHIKPHFRQEEDILLQFLPKDDKLVQRMCSEHETIRELMLSLDREPDKDCLVHLASMVHEHIFFEENEMFPHIETVLSPDALRHIHEQLEQKPLPQAGEWIDPFWNKT